ncbi:WhiB transcriptional factor [Gordonia phage GMA2]|uniref:4Fe-4S Wbl-type domain-containing protein n=1 Tax=Gordonia phage GMA2 TaxID=1647283 RepID=A0A0K0N7K4_9CAUD|nr:WhiB transcriptional factor [Gordonia phage GMA2]AKJ72656.1 hypothetical protein GMA2_118 [Gordonia phage GMA2]
MISDNYPHSGRFCRPENATKDDWDRIDRMFFPESSNSLYAIIARAACIRCPFRQACAQSALASGSGGIVAGILMPLDGDKYANSTNANKCRKELTEIAEGRISPEGEARDARYLKTARAFERISKLAEQGVKTPQIVEIVGVSERTVCKHRAVAGLQDFTNNFEKKREQQQILLEKRKRHGLAALIA